VLASFCVLDGPASSAEAKAISGFSYPKLESAINELQRLFLVPRPSIAEGLPRFSVNSNTKAMVLHIMEGSPQLRKVTSAVKSMTGQVYRDSSRRVAVSGYIMQATGLVRNKNYPDAEKTIKKGLELYSQDPDLHGALGWVYKAWSPRRTTDAREHFQRSAELKCKNRETYKHWYEMEEQEKNWGGAVEAARAALDVFKSNSLWTFRHGYTLSRYGQHLSSQLQPRAKANLIRADKVLSVFLESEEIAPDSEYQELHWEACRALCLNASSLCKLSTEKIEKEEKSEKDKWLARLAQVMLIWRSKHSDNPLTDYEVQKLISWHPEVRTMMKNAGTQ
jgi:tetratricopeptide (TPR) repeat protein